MNSVQQLKRVHPCRRLWLIVIILFFNHENIKLILLKTILGLMWAITNEITHYLSYLHHGGFFSHLGLRCAYLAFSLFCLHLSYRLWISLLCFVVVVVVSFPSNSHKRWCLAYSLQGNPLLSWLQVDLIPLREP